MKFRLHLIIDESQEKNLQINPKTETVEGNSLLEVCNKFMLLCIRVEHELMQKQIQEIKEQYAVDDDIPF